MSFSIGIFNSKNNILDIFKSNYINAYYFFFKEATLEEEEEAYLSLYKKIKEEDNFTIFITGTNLPEKLEYLIKQIKTKNIFIIYSINLLHKGLIKETDIKIYRKTISPAVIDYISRKSGISYFEIKNLNENECILEDGNNFKIVELNHLNKKMKYLK